MKSYNFLKQLPDARNQEGFVLITAMLILIVVTMLGIAASNTAYFETVISGNEKQYQQQFFKADAGINAELAKNSVPVGIAVPDHSSFNCASTTSTPFRKYDLDSDGSSDVALYLLSKGGTPVDIRVASCASLGNATAQIVAGIQYSVPPGGIAGPGDEGEYNN